MNNVIAAVSGAVVALCVSSAIRFMLEEKRKKNDKDVCLCIYRLTNNGTIQDVPELVKELSREGLDDLFLMCCGNNRYGVDDETIWDRVINIVTKEQANRHTLK